MLILSRKENESVVINDDIVIKVISIDKNSVKLGFDAPIEAVILREELRTAVLDENKKAWQSDSKSGNLGAIIKKIHSDSKSGNVGEIVKKIHKNPQTTK